ALEELGDGGGELHYLQAALDLALRVGEHLPVLGGDDRRQPTEVALDQLLELEHHPRALERRRLGPGPERLLRGGDRGVHLGRARQRDPAGDGAGGGIEHVGGAAALALPELASDEMADRSWLILGDETLCGLTHVPLPLHCFLMI